MKEVSISEAARIVGKDRKALYRLIKKGKLAQVYEFQNGETKKKIDVAELLRVFPDTKFPDACHETTDSATEAEICHETDTEKGHKSEGVSKTVARKMGQTGRASMIEMLQAQLDEAREREKAALERERQAIEREKALWQMLNQSEAERIELARRLLPPGQEMDGTPAQDTQPTQPTGTAGDTQGSQVDTQQDTQDTQGEQATEATGEATTPTESAGDSPKRSWWRRLFGA